MPRVGQDRIAAPPHNHLQWQFDGEVRTQIGFQPLKGGFSIQLEGIRHIRVAGGKQEADGPVGQTVEQELGQGIIDDPSCLREAVPEHRVIIRFLSFPEEAH